VWLVGDISASSVTTPELVDAAAGIHDLLLAGVERVAFGADLDGKILANGRTRFEARTATAGDLYVIVCRMYFRFHVSLD